MKPVAYAILAAALSLTACASGPPGHPHGYGYRDSPGRPYPTALPLPGYDYRFRPDPQGLGPDPQGLGRDLPPWGAYGHAPEPIVAWPHHGPGYAYVEQSGYVSGGESYSVREGYSEELYLEGGYVVEAQRQPYEPAPYASGSYGPTPYEPAPYQAAPYDPPPYAPITGQPYEADSNVFY